MNDLGAFAGLLNQFLRRHRAGEKISLAAGHPDLTEEVALEFGLDALCDEI
jgi:N-acyl-D-aspartate/D-glutamate deacylase